MRKKSQRRTRGTADGERVRTHLLIGAARQTQDFVIVHGMNGAHRRQQHYPQQAPAAHGKKFAG